MWYHQSRMICDMTANYEKKKISLNESSTDIIIDAYYYNIFSISLQFNKIYGWQIICLYLLERLCD